jgi:hypothetical protein
LNITNKIFVRQRNIYAKAMKANRLHIGVVLSELSKDFIDEDLMKEAKIRSLGIESTVLAHYVILRSEFHSNL